VALPAEPMARKDVPCRGPVVSTSASHVDSRGHTGAVTWPGHWDEPDLSEQHSKPGCHPPNPPIS
jgi:hypothetical protein